MSYLGTPLCLQLLFISFLKSLLPLHMSYESKAGKMEQVSNIQQESGHSRIKWDSCPGRMLSHQPAHFEFIWKTIVSHSPN